MSKAENEKDDGYDSDVEILNPRRLRQSFFKQQLRLVHEIKECGLKVPKCWTLFKDFINQITKWNPSEDVIHSVWKKMCAAERQVRGKSDPTAVIELSDESSDDDVPMVLKVDAASELDDEVQIISPPPKGSASESTPVISCKTESVKNNVTQGSNTNKTSSLKTPVMQTPLKTYRGPNGPIRVVNQPIRLSSNTPGYSLVDTYPSPASLGSSRPSKQNRSLTPKNQPSQIVQNTPNTPIPTASRPSGIYLKPKGVSATSTPLNVTNRCQKPRNTPQAVQRPAKVGQGIVGNTSNTVSPLNSSPFPGNNIVINPKSNNIPKPSGVFRTSTVPTVSNSEQQVQNVRKTPSILSHPRLNKMISSSVTVTAVSNSDVPIKKEVTITSKMIPSSEAPPSKRVNIPAMPLQVSMLSSKDNSTKTMRVKPSTSSRRAEICLPSTSRVSQDVSSENGKQTPIIIDLDSPPKRNSEGNVTDDAVPGPSGPPRKRKRPPPMSEVEAERLRERLLIDKLIELELPNILKNYMDVLPPPEQLRIPRPRRRPPPKKHNDILKSLPPEE